MAKYIEVPENFIIERQIMNGPDTVGVRRIDLSFLPAADVAPVVRCRECIYRKNERKDILFCDNFERDMLPDDFCSVGERKEG